jgi:magnesium-transporting ATPase (P-type)
LALGIEDMHKRGVLVRRLDAIESLASVSVVCFDKTGTLTMNQMRVVELAIGTQGPSGNNRSILLAGAWFKNHWLQVTLKAPKPRWPRIPRLECYPDLNHALNCPEAAFVTRLQPVRLPDQAARQLPGSTDNSLGWILPPLVNRAVGAH